MNVFEAYEQQLQKQKLFKEILSSNHSVNYALNKFIKQEFAQFRFKQVEYFNVKHIQYLNKEEYRFYKIPFKTGDSNSADKVKYEEVDGLQYNKVTGEQRSNESIEHSILSSLHRTKQKIYDYAYSNDWTNGYFFTITFNGDLVDRYNYQDCYNRIYQFLKNVKSKNKDFKYIFVPELHKDGAWHFHGLGVNCDNLKLVDSGIMQNGKKIYNINSRSYKYGFSTVSKVEDTNKVSSYITKYITKELVEHTKKDNIDIYLAKNLDVPMVENELRYDYEIDLDKKLLEANKNFEYKKVYAPDSTSNTIEYIHLKK